RPWSVCHHLRRHHHQSDSEVDVDAVLMGLLRELLSVSKGSPMRQFEHISAGSTTQISAPSAMQQSVQNLKVSVVFTQQQMANAPPLLWTHGCMSVIYGTIKRNVLLVVSC
ncbi:hypothetical protein Tco_0159565, partial [Tanacetum coccineum]